MIVPLTEYSRCIKVTEHNPNAMHSSPQDKEPVSQITSKIYFQFLGILLISEKCSSGCLEKMVLVKAKSHHCEGQQASFQMYLPFANTQLLHPKISPTAEEAGKPRWHENTVDWVSMG